jgi:hypothetical protein
MSQARLNQVTDAQTMDSRWHALFRIGGAMAVIMVLYIPIPIVLFIASPPPQTVLEFFALFESNKLLGLVGMDLLYLLANVGAIPMYLAFYVALRRASESAMLIATTLGLVAVVALFAARPAFEMLMLSDQYAVATTEAQRAVLLAAGEAMLAILNGTAFQLHYVLGSISLLMIAVVMLRSDIFSKPTAYVGIVASVTGLGLYVPRIGVAISILSVVGLWIWYILIARRFFQLSRGVSTGKVIRNSVFVAG